MGLRTSQVNQCLDRKLKVAGFEVVDLLVLLFVVSILNFITGPLNQRLITVWIPAIALACGLWLGKRGKPDKYLQHLLQYHAQPRELLAFPDPGESQRRFHRSLLSVRKEGEA